MVLLFLVRGVLLLSVLPPFEGWDEYQHLSYVVQLREAAGDAATADLARVPRSLYPALLHYPHSALGAEQLRSLGAMNYADFWRRGVGAEVPADVEIALYQRQHPPLYYRLAAPLYSVLTNGSSRPEAVLRGIVGLRGVNVLLGAAAVGMAVAAVGRLMRGRPLRYLVGLVIALQPLFLLNCGRVANDALAVLLGTAVVAIALLRLRGAWPWAIGAGALLGVGVLTKANMLALLPFMAVLLASWLVLRQISWRAAVVRGLLVLGTFAVVTGPYFYTNLAAQGVLTPMQEVVANRAAGRTWTDAWAAAAEIDWLERFLLRQVRHSLWVGGWSMLYPPALLNGMHQIAFYHALAGVAFAWPARRRRERLVLDDRGAIAGLAWLPVCVMAGLAYHAVQTKMAYGSGLTNSWYAAVAFPWAIVLGAQGLSLLPVRRAAAIFGVLTAATYLACEVYGALVVMPEAYVGGRWGPAVWERMARLHPGGWRPWWTPAAAAAAVLLAVLSAAVWHGAGRREGGPAAGAGGIRS